MNNTVEEVVETTYRELYLKALDKIDELEKALDKACEELESLALNKTDFAFIEKEQWKEWLLTDE